MMDGSELPYLSDIGFAPPAPLKGQGISFAARLCVSLEGRAQCPDDLLETVGALLVFGERKMRGRYTRAGSASLHLFKGRWGGWMFLLRVERG